MRKLIVAVAVLVVLFSAYQMAEAGLCKRGALVCRPKVYLGRQTTSTPSPTNMIVHIVRPNTCYLVACVTPIDNSDGCSAGECIDGREPTFELPTSTQTAIPAYPPPYP